MNKLFLIDTNQITYQDLIDYVNEDNAKNFSNTELFVLNTIKNLINKKIKNFEDLIENLFNSNKKIKLFTSGTTGKPKEVNQTFKNLIRNIKISKDREDDVWASFYQQGKMASYQVLFQSLLNKNTIVNMFGFNYDEIQNRILDFSITHISATPTLYKMIMSDGITYKEVRQITIGGEKSNESLQKNLNKVFPNAKITNVYASTEAGSLFSSNNDIFKLSEFNSEFIKIENNEILIREDYVGDSDEIKINDGWYYTGDKVEFVDDTNFKILGRKSNIIKIAGYNVNPEVIESKIESLDFVKFCKINSKENSLLGNVIICDVVLKKEIEIKTIKQYFKTILERHEIPSKINIVKSIEISDNGKLKR